MGISDRANGVTIRYATEPTATICDTTGWSTYTVPIFIVSSSTDPSNTVDQFGYVEFSDPNYINGTTSSFSLTDIGALDILQQNDIVPLMTFFPSS